MNQPFIEVSRVLFQPSGLDEQLSVSFKVSFGEIVCVPDMGDDGIRLLSFLNGSRVAGQGAVVLDGQLVEDCSKLPVLITGGRDLDPSLHPQDYFNLVLEANIEEYLSALSMSHLVPHLDTPTGNLPIHLLIEIETVLAIASGATCLLLYRPFESLDSGQRKRLHTLLDRFVKKGCSVVYTATDSSLYSFSHRVLELYKRAKIPVSEEPDIEGKPKGVFVSSFSMENALLPYLEGRVNGTGRLGEAIFNPCTSYGGLLPRLTVEEHFAYYLSDLSLIEYGHVHQKRLRGCVQEIFDSYSFDEIEQTVYPDELSEFQAVTVNLMIQLARLPQTLFCWFPQKGRTSSLLPSEKERVMRFLRTFVATGGNCIVFSDNLVYLNLVCETVLPAELHKEPHDIVSTILATGRDTHAE